MAFKLSCPRCKAEPDAAQLEVVLGKFECVHVKLQEDGFDLMEAKQLNTEDEQVFCNACEETFPLGECLDDEMNDPVPPGFSPEQWQAVEQFAQTFPDDSPPDENEVASVAARISTDIEHILTNTNIRAKVIAAALQQLAKELG